MTNWKDIWLNRSLTLKDDEKLGYEDLLKLNGFDGKQSNLTPDTLKKAIQEYERHMRIERGDSFYEVGCGSGAFLYHWYKLGHEVGGSDISPGLIDYAKLVLPKGDWEINEANKISVRPKYDHVTAFSLFFYFSDYDYAKETVYRMLLKARRSVSIFDIPDLAKKTECEDYRRKTIKDYDNKYADTQHLYYSKDWWINLAEDLGINYTLYNQDIEGYENSRWRYNITFNI